MHTPTRCPSASSIRIHTAEPVTSAPAVVKSVRFIHTGGRSWGCSSSTRSASSGSTTPTKLLTAAGRTCEHVATHIQEPRSTNLRRRPRATERLRHELASLRAEEVRPDRRRCRRSHVPVAQQQLVGDEHVSPLGVQARSPNSQHRSAPTPKPPTGDVQAAEATRTARPCVTDCPLCPRPTLHSGGYGTAKESVQRS